MSNTEAALQLRQVIEKHSHTLTATISTTTTITQKRHTQDYNTDNKPTQGSTGTLAYKNITTTNTNTATKRAYTQTRIDKQANNAIANWSHWGDKLDERKYLNNHITRIGFRNVKFLPAQLPNTRHQELIKDISESKLDILGMVETNLCWTNIPTSNKPQQRFKHEFTAVNVSYSYNATNPENFTKLQYGGTMIMSVNSCSHKIIETGFDTTKLGRWSWTRYRGPNSMTLRIVCVYRPVRSNCINGVYRQHETFYKNNNIDTCPRLKIMEDLDAELRAWTSIDNYFIVMGDFNENICGNFIKSFFSKFNMKEAIQSKHGENSPNSHANGTLTIDGIFISNDLPVIKGGYSPVLWGLQTDHRMIWADVDLSNIFDRNQNPINIINARRLKSEDPRCVIRFIKSRVEHSTKSRLLAKLTELQNNITNNSITLEEGEKILDHLDIIRTEGIRTADKGCRRLPMGKIAWSPQLTHIINRLQYYRLCIKKLSGSKINARTLFKAKLKAGTTDIPQNMYEAADSISQIYCEFKELKKSATQTRVTHLENLAAAQSQASNIQYSTVLKNIQQREHIKSTFATIKNILKPGRYGVSRIEVQNTFTSGWKLVETKDEIENGCIAENIRRFTQASHTPAMQPCQVKLLGKLGESQLATDIINGSNNENYKNLHYSIQQLIPFFRRSENLDSNISTSLTIEEAQFYWKRSKEKTSCGPSGLHYGHFQVSSKHPVLASIDKIFLELSMTYGFILSRWCKTIDVMIPKKADSVKVNKLRTIMLFESDWNQMNKIIGHRIMQNSEKFNTMAPEQYGSRKGKSAIQHATNKMLLYDLLRQKKINAILIILDALSCYDRIILAFAALGLRRQGATIETTRAMFLPLLNMQHFIRTTFGDSKIFYQQSNQMYHGIGQGNGAGPAIWATTSSPLLDEQRHNNCGLKLELSDSTICHIPSFTFVDDNDMNQNVSDESNITKESQQALDIWDRSLKATGGACAPEKCSWTSMIHKWVNNKWMIQSIKQTPANLILKDDKGVSCILKRVPIEVSTQALGIMFNPLGRMQSHFIYLRDKCKEWAEKIMSSKIPRSAVFTAMNCTILRTVDYGLLSTTFTRKQCNTLTNIILCATLPKSGICRSISRKPVFSSAKYQGFGIKHPYYTQGYRKLEMMINSNDELGNKLISEAIITTALESGLGPNFLAFKVTRINDIIEKTWISSLWQFLHDCKIKLVNNGKYEGRFKNDWYIMQLVPEDSNKEAIKDMNFCRLNLRVELISDILSLNGKFIRKNVWNGQYNAYHNNTDTRKWPKRPTPTKYQWKNWKKMLQQIFKTNEDGQLLNPFTINEFEYNKWNWFYNKQVNRIYQRVKDETFVIWSVIPQRITRQYKFQQSITTNTLCLDAIPCTIGQQKSLILVESTLDNLPTVPSNDIPADFFTQHSTISNNTLETLEIMKQEFSNDRLTFTSDGSYRLDKGTGAWICTSKNAFPLVLSGSVVCPGEPNVLDSHRCECIGIAGALDHFHNLLDTWKLNSGKITFYCDNQSALNYAFNIERYPSVKATFPDFDILKSIRARLKPTIKYLFDHVKGHQDSRMGPLTFPETMNVLADREANIRRLQITSPIENYILPEEKWSIFLNGKKLCKSFELNLYDHWSKPNMQSYWNKQRDISENTFNTINWEAISSASSLWSREKQRWMVKHCVGVAGVNKVLHDWKKSPTPNCLLCGDIETTNHVWKCTGKSAHDNWVLAIEELNKWLLKMDTSPDLRKTIITNLQHWLTDSIPSTNRTPLELAQDMIGWNYLIEGLVPITWSIHQQIYYKSKNKLNNGFRWLSQLIQKLWKIAWDIWQHRNNVTRAQRQLQESTEVNQAIVTAFTADHPHSSNYLFSKKYKDNILLKPVQSRKLWMATLNSHKKRANKAKRLKQTRI
jgi:hypothetical protein